MNKPDIFFILLHITTILIIILFAYILRRRKKTQIHKIFLCALFLQIIWCISVIIGGYIKDYDETLVIYSEYFAYIGACLIPVSILFLGMIFAKTKIKFSHKHLMLFVIPTISLLVLWTSDYHNLFYKNFSVISSEIIYGNYFLVHTLYSYVCILIGLYYLIYFSIKNSGFFSKQALLIIIGTSVPLITNILFTFNLVTLSIYGTPVTFSFAIICFVFAILKYDFLSISPVALQNVVDRISDSFIVLDEALVVIDYNKTFYDVFNGIFKINRKDSFANMLTNSSILDVDQEKILETVLCAIEKRSASSYEHHIKGDSFDKHFIIEITPINSNDSIIGTIILFKDITDHKRYIETINRNQQTLMERERLAFLGELIGGIAHNLKTPIMSVSGGLEGIYDLIKEYDESIEDKNVTKEDHHEIAKEMEEWIIKLKPHLSYMSEIISTVKDQAVHLNAVTSYSFTLSEMIKRIEILVKNELKLHHCELNMDVRMDETVEIFGDISSLIQVFDNLIINAIDAYGEASGEIDLIVEKADDNNILFTVRDYACGMDNDVKNKLFKQMVTTKGKGGTGLGLYMSHSTIKGRFGGDIWFDSEKGKGTTFFIQIPKKFETTNSEQNSNHEQIA